MSKVVVAETEVVDCELIDFKVTITKVVGNTSFTTKMWHTDFLRNFGHIMPEANDTNFIAQGVMVLDEQNNSVFIKGEWVDV